MTSEHEIERYNERTLWADVANHLLVAVESIEQAQSALEDLHKDEAVANLAPLAAQLVSMHGIALVNEARLDDA